MKSKIPKYAANEASPLIVQPGNPFFSQIKGERNQKFFHNQNPIVLELACGKGEYTVGLAQHYPEKNFIGIDIKGDRIRSGTQKAVEKKLHNVGFLRTIIHHLENFFAPGEVDEIWIVHPDPRPRNADARRRLTFPRFLKLYQNILKPGGILRLKTDNTDLFDYSLETLQSEGWNIQAQTHDLYHSPLLEEHYGIKTHFEEKFVKQGETIKYLRATPPAPLKSTTRRDR